MKKLPSVPNRSKNNPEQPTEAAIEFSEEQKKWSKRGKHDREAIEERKKKLAAARKYLRKDLHAFLEAVGITENDPEYDELVAVWREFHG